MNAEAYAPLLSAFGKIHVIACLCSNLYYVRISRNGNFKHMKRREANSTVQLEVEETLNHYISFKKSTGRYREFIELD